MVGFNIPLDTLVRLSRFGKRGAFFTAARRKNEVRT